MNRPAGKAYVGDLRPVFVYLLCEHAHTHVCVCVCAREHDEEDENEREAETKLARVD